MLTTIRQNCLIPETLQCLAAYFPKPGSKFLPDPSESRSVLGPTWSSPNLPSSPRLIRIGPVGGVRLLSKATSTRPWYPRAASTRPLGWHGWGPPKIKRPFRAHLAPKGRARVFLQLDAGVVRLPILAGPHCYTLPGRGTGGTIEVTECYSTIRAISSR